MFDVGFVSHTGSDQSLIPTCPFIPDLCVNNLPIKPDLSHHLGIRVDFVRAGERIGAPFAHSPRPILQTWQRAAPTRRHRHQSGGKAPGAPAFRCGEPRRPPRNGRPCSVDTARGAERVVLEVRKMCSCPEDNATQLPGLTPNCCCKDVERL